MKNYTKKILKLFLTEKCNKRCPYCFLNCFKSHFKKEKLKQLDSLDKIESVQFYGGEPGMLSKEELQLIFNKLSSLTNIKKARIYTNSLFFQRYSLKQFNIPNWQWLAVIHFLSIKDYKKFKIYDDIFWNFVVVLNDENDFNILKYILKNKHTGSRIDCLFPCNFKNNLFITKKLYNNWINLINDYDLSGLNIQNQINPLIFKKLLNINISYELFKSLLVLNKDMSNRLCSSFTEKKIKINLF